MKSSYKKMLIFQFIIFIIFLLNSFVSNILNRYNLIIFLLLLLILFKVLFGFERDRNRYTKDMLYETIIFLIIFFIAFYLFGIKIGFLRIENYYSLYGLTNFILPLIFSIILKEILRYMMLKKIEGSELLKITTCILFICLEITTIIFYTNFSTGSEIFTFISLSLLPAIVKNIVFNYISQRVGYKPVILYSLVMELYVYLIPIIPDINDYIKSLVRIILPLILGYRIYKLFEKEKDKYLSYDNKKQNLAYLLAPVLFTIIVVYFTSGYFKYYTIVIASGSMSPEIDKGDVVVIEKIKNKDKLKKNDVIAYKYNNIIVVHRIIEIIKTSEENYYYTKGDSNLVEDSYAITEDMIVGKVNITIPYIGYPTVWLNEL